MSVKLECNTEKQREMEDKDPLADLDVLFERKRRSGIEMMSFVVNKLEPWRHIVYIIQK